MAGKEGGLACVASFIERFNMERDEWFKRYLDEIEKATPLASAQEGEPGEREVRANMIRANLRLVVKIVKEQWGGSEVPVLDLISAGNIGLMKAVGRFDPSKEGELSTFASWWIRQSIKRVVAKSAKKFPAFFAQAPPDKGSDEDLALPA